MTMRMNYSPEGDGGGIAQPEAGAADTGATGTTGAAEGGEAAGGTAEPARHDVAELEAKFDRGEQLTAEELAFYEASDKDMEGAKPEPEEDEQTEEAKPEPAKEPDVPEWQSAAMKSCGAKTPEELPEKLKGLLKELSNKGSAISGFKNLVEQCKAGDQRMIGEFRRIYGFDPFAAPQPAATQQPPAQQEAKARFTREMFIDPMEGEEFLNEFSSIKSELGSMKELFGRYEQTLKNAEQREAEADRRAIQSSFLDDVCDMAELHREDLGLSNVPIRSAMEQLLTTGSLGENNILAPLAEFLAQYGGRNGSYGGLTPKEYYKLLNFDKYGERLAKAKAEALGEARKGLFNGRQNRGAAAAQNAPSLSDHDLRLMMDRRMDIPKAFFDADGEPDPRKMPKALLEAFNGAG